MRKRGMSEGGCLFIFGMVGGAIYLVAHRLVTGHLPDHWDYGLWGLIAGSILADAEGYLTKMLERTEEIRKDLKDLAGEVQEVKERCDTLNWKLNQFKTEFDESSTSLQNDLKEGLRSWESTTTENTSKRPPVIPKPFFPELDGLQSGLRHLDSIEREIRSKE